MSNRRTQADIDQSHSAIQPSGCNTQGHSLSSSSASFHQSTSAPPPPTSTADQQWFPNPHQMIVTSSSFYDPAQASSFTPQQPTMNVWDAQFTPPAADYFPRQHPTYQQPYPFEPPPTTTQYSFVQDQPRPVMPTSRRSARGSSRPSGYYRQGGAQSHQRAQYPQVAPSNPPSTQPQPSQPPTGQALAAQRTTQLIAGQFPPVQNEQQYSTQPQYSPPPTQSQFQIQQTQFPPPAQFSQTQAQGRQQSQFAQPHVPSQSHVTTQSHGAQPQAQVHAPPPNQQQQQQSQHYPAQSDSYYLQSDMYYAMNAQGSQSTPSLVSLRLNGAYGYDCVLLGCT
ncbi:hypothetical protein P692DRAFT_20851360 [Suillus brevipes Sb2]|nr:hypothetical protein P692DRAFT_20851360 [Suillus brevipes Sb2]